MVIFDAHPWIRFTAGLIAGCWLGAAIGCGMMVLLTGRRLRQLEAANELLRQKLQTRDRRQRATATGTGPSLVAGTGIDRPASAPLRAAGGSR